MSGRNLSQKDIRNILNLTEKIHCTDFDRSFAEHISVVLRHALPSTHFTVDSYSLIPFKFKRMINDTLPSDTLERAAPHMHQHPGLAQTLDLTQPQFGSIQTLLKRNDFQKTSLYNEVMQDLEIEDQIWMGVGDPLDFTAIVFCWDQTYGEREHLLLSHLYPHVKTAHANWKKMQALQQALMHSPSDSHACGSSLNPLTNRQREIANQVAAGRTNREIADQLKISHRTVAKHLEQIYETIGVHTRTALANLWLK